MSTKTRGRLAGLLAGIVFLVGYGLLASVPGGGAVTDKDFTDYYNSSGRRATGFLGFVALAIGGLLLVWFFTELRDRLPVNMISRVGYLLGIIGTAFVLTGGAVLMGPTGVQMNSDAGFVGVAVAHTFAQAGLGLMLGAGMYSLAAAVFLCSLAARSGRGLPNWLAILGIVIAVLMLGSYIWAPGLLFPIWVIIVGAAGMNTPITDASTTA